MATRLPGRHRGQTNNTVIVVTATTTVRLLNSCCFESRASR